MRVLYLSTSLGMGGAERQILSVATELQRKGHQVRLVSLTPLGQMGLEARAAGFDVDSLEMRRGVPDLRAIGRLLRICRRFRPDVVHSNMIHANLLARVSRPLYRAPVLVCTAHNVYEGAAWRGWAYRLTDPFCDLTTQVSQPGADRYVALGMVPAGRMMYVPNTMDPSFLPNPDARERMRAGLDLGDRFIWLSVGRFAKAKDPSNMIEAFAQVAASRPDAILLLVGEGPLESMVRAEVTELGLDDQVRFLGVRRDVPDIMNAADAFVMSSAWEGMPTVLLEAGAVGLPAVATAVGGVVQVVQDGTTGYLVPPARPDLLGEAMFRFMSLSEPERRQMSEAARSHVETNHGVVQVSERWLDIYSGLLRDKRPAQ